MEAIRAINLARDPGYYSNWVPVYPLYSTLSAIMHNVTDKGVLRERILRNPSWSRKPYNVYNLGAVRDNE